jgi:hypothetical protein
VFDSIFISVQVDLHVSTKESEKSAHSFSFDLSTVVSVEVIPGFIEIFAKVILLFSTF